MFYSAPPGTWQLLEERIDTRSPFPHGVTSGSDAADIDKHQQYVWGPRYIDDLVLDRLDANKDGDFIDATDKNYFHCTDAQFTTVTLIDRLANVIERRTPDEYGKMRLCAREDVDGDGDVDTTDKNIALANSGTTTPAAGDVDNDGDVDATDVSIINAKIGTNYRYGQLTTTDSVIGWDGYVFNSEIDGGGMYTVRFRHYRPDLGRWLRRDPIGYIDGPNVYQYVSSSSVRFMDPLGLCDCGVPEPGAGHLEYILNGGAGNACWKLGVSIIGWVDSTTSGWANGETAWQQDWLDRVKQDLNWLKTCNNSALNDDVDVLLKLIEEGKLMPATMDENGVTNITDTAIWISTTLLKNACPKYVGPPNQQQLMEPAYEHRIAVLQTLIHELAHYQDDDGGGERGAYQNEVWFLCVLRKCARQLSDQSLRDQIMKGIETRLSDLPTDYNGQTGDDAMKDLGVSPEGKCECVLIDMDTT